MGRIPLNTDEKPSEYISMMEPAAPQRNSAQIQRKRYDFEETNPILRDLPDELKKFVQTPQGTLEDHWVRASSSVANCWLIGVGKVTGIHCLVPEGEIGLTWHGATPKILSPGRHFLWSPTHQFYGTVNILSRKHIQHGSIHIVSVSLGEVGLGLDAATGDPVILTSGQHFIDSNTFEFKTFSQLETQQTRIGQLVMVRIEVGEVGYGYRGSGELMLLKPGLHLIKPPDRFTETLSLLVEIVNLRPTCYESKDYVQIQVSAGIYFQIRDPYKTLTVVGSKIKQQIKELGAAALQQIIRSTTLVDIAGSDKVAYKEEKQEEKGEKDFYAKMHDEFMSRLHDHILKEWGVEISNIRIENLQIADRQLAQSIAAQAVEVSKQEAEHMMLEKQTQIMKTRADNAAMEIDIQTQAEAQKIKAMAQAEADAVIIKAQAQKEKKELEGQGEAEYSRLLESTRLGSELALLKIHKNAMEGINQVVYVPHLPKMLGKDNPLIVDGGLAMPGN